MATSDLRNDYTYSGTVSVTGTLNMPSGTVEDADVNAGAAIAATKLEHQFAISNELFEEATTITAVNRWIHMVRGATGEIVGIEAAVATNPTGADRTVDVELHKSTGAGAFASVLSSPCNIVDGTADRTAVLGTISSADLVAGDILRLVVTVAGGAGNQALGLLVTVTLREDPA